MNTILLQKILDILREGLAHVGDFFKDLFISDPQDGQIIAYDAESGHWINMDATEVELDLTNTFEAQAVATITDGAENVPMKSLIVDIVPKQASGTPTPDNPLPISGSNEVVITHTYGDNETETKTITLPSTVYGGEVDWDKGKLVITHAMKNISDMYFDTLSTPENHIFRSNYTQYLTDIKCPATNNELIGSISEQASEMSYTQISASDNGKYAFSIESTNRFVMIDTACSTVSDFITAHVNDKIVYPLATPIEIDLSTPTTIKTQGGTESIYSDTGDVSGEYYTKTAESVLALANITEDITGTITKNTTDFSDILFKASRNNKVVSIEIYSASTSAAVNATFLSGLPKPAMNCKILLVNTTLGEDGIIRGTLKTTGELDITTSGAKSFSGLITYVAK